MKSRSRRPGFSILELIVSVGVLVILLVLIGSLFNSATLATGIGSRHMDADSQARAVFDRMAVDISQIVLRPDVDYYLKDAIDRQPGNDQCAFYAYVPGSYPASVRAADQNPLSLAGYRVNTAPNSGLERLAYGLLWSGSAPDAPVFTAKSRSSGETTLSRFWPCATTLQPDSRYELIGPQVFRFEYYYLLKTQTVADGQTFGATLSDVPWDQRIRGIPGIPDHDSVDGLADVGALIAAIGVIDSQSQEIVQVSSLATLAAEMGDFIASSTSGQLETQWQEAIGKSSLPPAVISALRIYSRAFPLPNGARRN